MGRRSILQRLADLPAAQRLAVLDALPDQALELLRADWAYRARPDQMPPLDLDWEIWLILAGRGYGKTRTGAETLADWARSMPGTRWAVVAPTGDDVSETCFHGESGLLTAVLHESEIAAYSSLKKKITLQNGSIIRGFAGIEPERLRGPQFHGAWVDEPASCRRGGVDYVERMWDMLTFGVRLPYTMPDGSRWRPRFIVTGTPKPIPLIRKWIKQEREGDTRIHVTRGSTYDNIANLAPAAVRSLLDRYEGTRLGRQELHAEVLEDVEGALWTMATIEAHRIKEEEQPDLVRIVVAVDPAATSSDASNETGIVVCGRDANGHGYLLADYSLREHPDRWARVVIDAYDTHKADRVVVETNQGGQMIAALLRTHRPNLPISEVTASRGKVIRAEPIAALYEQGKVHHVGGFPVLETQITEWTPDLPNSPDRLDALVWGFTDLLEHSSAAAFVAAAAPPCPVCHQPKHPDVEHKCVGTGSAFLDGALHPLNR